MWLRINRIVLFLMGTVSVCVACSYLLRQPIARDSWFHASIGKFIVATGRLPVHEDFSVKITDTVMRFVPHSWLADSITYLVFNAHERIGPVGMEFFSLLLTLTVINAILQILRVELVIRVLSMPLIIALLLPFWQMHPLLFAAPLLATLMRLYFAWREHKQEHIWLWPLTMVFFANMAGGYLIIPILFLLVILIWEVSLATFFRFSKEWTRSPPLRMLCIYILLAVAAGFVHPFTWRVYTYVSTIWSVFSAPRHVINTLPGALKMLYQNYVKISLSPTLFSLFALYSLVLIILVGIILTRRNKRIRGRIIPLLPLMAGFALAFVWIRFIPLATIITFPIFAVCLSILHEHTKKPITSVLKYGGIAGALAVQLLLLREARALTPDLLPTQQIEFIQSQNMPDTVLTSPDITGYFLYRTGRKIVLDAQDDLYDELSTLHLYVYEPIVTQDEIANLEKSLHINTLLVDRNFGQIERALAASTNWQLLHFDYSGYVYVKRFAVSESFLSQHALSYIHLDRALGFDPNEATAAANQLKSYIQKHPDNTLAIGQLASIYRITGNLAEAYTLLTGIPGSALSVSVLTELGRVQAAMGLCKSAETSFLSAIKRRNEMNFSRATVDIAMLYALCFKDTKKATRYFQRYDSFVLPTDERERVRQLMQDAGITLQP